MSASTKCKVCGQDNPPEAGFCGNCGAALVAEVKAPAAATAVAAVYMGFWIRFAAAIIDGVIVGIISSVLIFLTVWFLRPMSWFLLLLLYHWLFTGLRGQSPGKMAVGIKVVDAQGNRPSLGIAALREILGRLVSTVGLFVGFLWIAWDKEKQGWHDRIATTHVVKVVKAKSTE